MINRKAKRLLKKKLGENFPLDNFLSLYEYQCEFNPCTISDFIVNCLTDYITLHYDEFIYPFTEENLGGNVNVSENSEKS